MLDPKTFKDAEEGKPAQTADLAGSKRRYLRPKVKKPPKKRWWKFIFRLLFSHVGLLVICCGYSAFGAWLFIRIEIGNEDQRRALKDVRALEVNDSINYLSSLFWYWQDKNFTLDEWNSRVFTEVKGFESYVIQSVDEYGYDGGYGTWEYDWTYPKSLLFTVSTITTIGYGNITPKTSLGMIVVIVYSLVGIPLTLLFLANIGSLLASGFKYAYSRLLCRWCRARRKTCEYQKGDETVTVARDYARLADETVGNETYMATAEVQIPILLTLAVIALYVVVGAVVFSKWEQWHFVESVYFTFVTFGTIGFGDYIPGRSFLADGDGGFGAGMRMLFTCAYCMTGMALVSMALSLMQEQITYKVKWVAREVGITKDDANAEQ